jgi:hypothetical protein
MLNIIRFDWNNIWTFKQIKLIENRYETLFWLIKKRKHELDDTLNLDDATTYFYESNAESSCNIRHIILDDRQWDILHLMISMTCIQCYSFNLFMFILSFVLNTSITIILNLNHRHQLYSLSWLLHLNLNQSVKHLWHFVLRINIHAHHHHLRSSSLHQHFRIWHHMFRHRFHLDFRRSSSKNCRNWTKFIRTMRNSKIQTIISTSNWESFTTNVDASNYHHMRTWKRHHSYLRNEH